MRSCLDTDMYVVAFTRSNQSRCQALSLLSRGREDTGNEVPLPGALGCRYVVSQLGYFVLFQSELGYCL